MCLCSHRCVCFDRCEERRLNVQTEKKKQSLFILTHSIQKLNFLIGLAKRSFGNCSQKSTNHKGGKVGCGNFNCAPPSKPFMDQNKTNRKNKDSRTACLWRSISYMKLLSDSSSFFLLLYCLSAWHIQCFSDYTKYYAARGAGWRWGGETWDEMGRQEDNSKERAAMNHDTSLINCSYRRWRERMNGKSAGWTGLQLLVSWMKGLMGCGRNR